MQTTRLQTTKRRTSRWNAFLSKEIQRRNAALDDGETRARVSDGEITREIATQWKAMSEAEQVAATEDVLKELHERQENHKRGVHTVPIQAFHDTRATIATIQRELEDLHTRTGTEVLLFVVRADTKDYTVPYSFYTNKRLADYVLFATQNTTSEFALKLEGYCVSGMQGE
ncbi:hypothetical protein NUW54_g14758 [Trametes sanguinea]|uniref:Uncharacterized protein n=1 Tax=Trametes sanguinea TaxID=158606 RepID=A0ACC1MAW6_9APHY|nr:hypothetical protein NUW54_g14758 [Trametes sanguinea]